jgi:hypothetical protein
LKVLLIALENTLDYTVPLLEADGHNVRLLTHCRGIPLMLALPECKAYVLEQIADFAPDLVINSVTPIVLPTSSDYTYLGNNWVSARLETHKWETREKAASLGWSVPTVLEECTMDTMSPHSGITYLKAKGRNILNGAVQVPVNTVYNDAFPKGVPAYVEADLDYAVGAYCMFTIANGSYHITRIIGFSPNTAGNEKSIESDGDWTGSYTVVELTSSASAAFLAKCTAWLDYVVTLGGNYSGDIGGGITASNEVFWFEQNSRPSQYAESFTSGTIQDWIDGLSTDPTKSPPITYKTET